MKTLFVALLLFTPASIALAQSNDGDFVANRCWLAGLSFTAGATVRAGNQVMVCTKDGSWENTESWASICIREGEGFSIGAEQHVPNIPEILLTCKNDGTWESSAVE